MGTLYQKRWEKKVGKSVVLTYKPKFNNGDLHPVLHNLLHIVIFCGFMSLMLLGFVLFVGLMNGESFGVTWHDMQGLFIGMNVLTLILIQPGEHKYYKKWKARKQAKADGAVVEDDLDSGVIHVVKSDFRTDFDGSYEVKSKVTEVIPEGHTLPAETNTYETGRTNRGKDHMV